MSFPFPTFLPSERRRHHQLSFHCLGRFRHRRHRLIRRYHSHHRRHRRHYFPFDHDDLFHAIPYLLSWYKVIVRLKLLSIFSYKT